MNEARVRELISTWLEMVESSGEPFDDMHVDQIDSAWRDRSTWAEAAIKCLTIATDLIAERQTDQTAHIGMSLVSAGPRVNFPNNESELLRQTDWSPWSIYIFVAGTDLWRPSDRTFFTQFDVNGTLVDVMFLSWNADSENRRSAFLRLPSP